MNANEVLHQFRHGPVKVSILAPKGAKLVTQFRFEFVRVDDDGLETSSFDWFSLASLSEAAEAGRRWVRDAADSGRI